MIPPETIGMDSKLERSFILAIIALKPQTINPLTPNRDFFILLFFSMMEKNLCSLPLSCCYIFGLFLL